MAELSELLTTKREKDHEHNKFLAALQGIDLEKNSSRTTSGGSGNPWEDLKARVFSRGQAANANDVLSLQGSTAVKAGIGIGNGLSHKTVQGGGSFWD